MAESRIVRTPARPSDLLPRIIVGVLLIALALAVAKLGGYAFSLLVAVVILLVYTEWCQMHGARRGVRLAGMFMLAAACYAASLGVFLPAVVIVAAAGALGILVARMAGLGIFYAGAPAIAVIWLRAEPNGFASVMWLLAIVWATDIFAFFAGRAIGGPKIAPRISPSKTWAGLGGGMVGAGITAGVLASRFDFVFDPVAAGLVGAALAVLAQAGDFFESWLKRRAGVKDSGTLLPGHGGVMDRVDGVVPVAVAVALTVWAAG
jgi:phosphatidate cytidylyltransferase